MNLLPPVLVDKAREVVEANRAAGRRVAVAESCTGGLVSAAITEIPGSSEVFEAGYVTYSNAAKLAGLNVSENVVETFGAVSIAVAWAMALGALKASGADVAVAITGVAGPAAALRPSPSGRSCSRSPNAMAIPPRSSPTRSSSTRPTAPGSGFRRRFARLSCYFRKAPRRVPRRPKSCA